MCGIAGIVSVDGSSVTQSALKRMTDRIAYRGPDAEGFWTSQSGGSMQAGLGHRRLSILDLSDAGRQPMLHSPSGGRYAIVFNGEIYNYLELKAGLEARGHRFASGTDTEVLLALYAERGSDCLDELDGMFAFAIWDSQERTLFCARDRLGEKPLYYAFEPGKRFVFGSEPKCLFAADVPRRVRPERLFDFLAYEAVEDPRDPGGTFFEGVEQLRAAHWLRVRGDGRVEQGRYWQAPAVGSAPPSFEDACERLRELFDRSLKLRLRSDVPVGTCLSGGLDSSSIVVGLDKLREGGGQFSGKTFSARMPDPQLDEGAHMQAVIDRVGAHRVEPHFVSVDADVALGELDRLMLHQEEPFATTSPLAQWLVMRLASQQGVPVLIDGQGADEILGGYEGYYGAYITEVYRSGDRALLESELAGYKQVKGRDFELNTRFKAQARFPALLSAAGSLRRRLAPASKACFEGVSFDWIQRHGRREAPFLPKPSLDQALRQSALGTGLTHLLRLCDRSSMAFSREVRLPFLSRELVDFVFSLPASYKLRDGWSKFLLRRAMSDRLPESIAWRRDKLGFVAPQAAWLSHPKLAPRIADAIEYLKREGVIERPIDSKKWLYLQAAMLLQGGKK